MIPKAKTCSEKKVSTLHEFLLKVKEAPREFVSDATLINALQRQGRLGHYENQKYNVERTSRSTIQRVCDRLLIGGAKAFDELRREALGRVRDVAQVLSEAEPAPRRTRDFFKIESRTLKEHNQLLMEDCFQLTAALHATLVAGRKLAAVTHDPAAKERWNKHETQILGRLRLVKKLVVAKGGEVERWAESVRSL